MSYNIKPLNLSDCNIGKSPYWNPRTESLYYVDLYCPALLRYDFNKRTTYKTIILNETVASFVIPIEHVPRFFLVGLNLKIGIIEWNGISETCEIVKILFEVEQEDIEYNQNRFNIGKIDPTGRFFGGTMCSELKYDNFLQKRLGKLYKYHNCQKEPPIIVLDNVGIPNGFTWNPVTNKFYYIDSVDFDIKEFDFDPETGDIINPNVFINFLVKDKENNSIPDIIPNDITIDSNGFLYVCGLNNATIYKIDPSTKTFVDEINMHTKSITAITFGGPDMDILYVTTSAVKYMKIEPDHNEAGKVFEITGLNVTGIEMKNMKLKLCLCQNNTKPLE